MECESVLNGRFKKLEELRLSLKEIDKQLLCVSEDIGWDYDKLLKDNSLNMVTCSVNEDHRVYNKNLQEHEEECLWKKEGYADDKIFPEHTGYGSFITLTPEKLKTITENVPTSQGSENIRLVPQSSAKYDQNFTRDEKLAIYDYVICNTEKQISFSDLFLLSFEEKKEKKKMTAWEIAAAERDAKRRRASYRNKVHTNRKTHTEILREVIDVQMEHLKEQYNSKTKSESIKSNRDEYRKTKHRDETTYFHDRKKHSKSKDTLEREDKYKSKYNCDYSRHRDHSFKRSPTLSGNDSDFRSRSHDKSRKWSAHEGRSLSFKSSYSHKKKMNDKNYPNV